MHVNRFPLSRRAFVLSSMVSVGALVSGCGNQMSFPVNAAASRSLAERNVEVIPITAENIHQYTDATWLRLNGLGNNPPADPRVYSYRVGSGDQLRIVTWTTPERSAGSDISNITEGPVINEAGEFFYPFVGMMRARGLTVSEIRQNLETALREFIANPQVEVAVQDYRAHRVTITGSITSPGSTKLTNVPLRLLDLVNSSGSTERSDLRHIIIRRQGQEYMVNLLAFMEQGLADHNPILLPDDIIFVPALADNRVFTFGEIGVGEIRLGPERKTLTEVLAAQGGPSRLRGDARGIFVFRAVPGQPDAFIVFQFNLLDATSLMLTSQFAMAPMDVVFVTTDPITRWNDTVGRILTPVSGVVRAQNIIEELAE